MTTPTRRFCDDAPVSYEPTAEDLAGRPSSARPSTPDIMPEYPSTLKAGDRIVCDDAPVSYEVTEDDFSPR